MSERSPSTDTRLSPTLLVLWDVFDLETDEVFLTALIRFLSEDLSLGVAGDDFRFCSVFEADSEGES